MLRLKWTSVTIEKNSQANEMVRLFNSIPKESVGAFDTETTGLHIIHSKPFLYQFGFMDESKGKGYTFAVDLERHPLLADAVIQKWQELAKGLKIYFGHNVKYDLHIMHNINRPYTHNNISDTMFYIRAAHDALKESNGGPPLALKDYSARYIYPKAKDHESAVARERSAIAKELNLLLKQRLASCGKPPEKYCAKSYTLSVIEEMFKDPVIDIDDLPKEVKEAYTIWLNDDLPIWLRNEVTGKVEAEQIPYNKVNRKVVTEYAHWDIILTLETYLNTRDTIQARGTYNVIEIENGLIYPLVHMERTGFNIDIKYLENCRIAVKEYIKERREHIWRLAGQEFKTGQHELIKDILNNEYNANLTSTNDEMLSQKIAELRRKENKTDNDLSTIDFITALQELRTLEKWYSVYIMRFLKDLKQEPKLYPTILSIGAVSGRVTSAFQQFPRDGIVDKDGNELFHPRKMVIGDIVCIDFSQVELRLQAMYTILVNDPDKNMCRAYMPYQCYRDDSGQRVEFDYNNPEHIKRWGDLRPGYPDPSQFKDGMEEVYKQGWSVWKHIEDDQYWIPVDLHAETTMHATGMTKSDPGFKNARRDVGKKVNFGKQYGASLKRIMSMFPEKSYEECVRIDGAYYTAFPGVRTYHDYCTVRGNNYDYTSNLFGVKYYGVGGHKLKNMLVQGSAAYYLKWKIKLLYEYIVANDLKTRMMFQVHDEIIFIVEPSELDHIPKFKAIMEDWSDGLVPIVAEIDASNTNWASKKGVHSVDELRVCFRD